MRGKTIRVGIFDQIVSGGGVRLFTTKLLEEFSKLAGNKWHFHLMWPLFDSSNNFLPRPHFKHVSFERINVNRRSRTSERVLPLIHKMSQTKKLSERINPWLLNRIQNYEQTQREDELKMLRPPLGLGLDWLDGRIKEFDLLYIPYPYLTLPEQEQWKPDIPVIITLHDLAHEQTDAWGGETERLQREVRKWVKFSSLVIFSSDFVKNEAKKIYGLPETQIKRIYLASAAKPETRERPDVLKRFGLKKGYIFTLGWAAKHKQVEAIIESFSLFKKKWKMDVSLVIAGPRTETLTASNTYGLKVGEDLFALGYIRDEDIPTLYKNASVVVTASLSEAGFNSMVFDAMCYGIPLICSNIPQFIERLGAEDSLALTFDPHSTQSLSDALSEHFGDPERSALRASSAQRFIISRNVTHVGEEYLKAFESVL